MNGVKLRFGRLIDLLFVFDEVTEELECQFQRDQSYTTRYVFRENRENENSEKIEKISSKLSYSIGPINEGFAAAGP